MKITSVKLDNFRIYKGSNVIRFPKGGANNITLISGKNGFGKTTFLTSLIWGLYGNQMAVVEDKYKSSIKNAGGYEQFLKSLMNKDLVNEFENGNTFKATMQVVIQLEDVLIPSIPCDNVRISRSYDYATNTENLSILIDGFENELTKDVGYEIFINDFILPREIAKFFFFDAEKIVNLAEAKTKSELRSLSHAYSEVLGIKKYEDLKTNLLSLLTKIRRRGVKEGAREKLDELINKDREFDGLVKLNEDKQGDVKKEIADLDQKIDIIQEKLIREGSEISLEQLKSYKLKKDTLKTEHQSVKNELKKYHNIIPFLIAREIFEKLIDQLKMEMEAKSINDISATLKRELDLIKNSVITEISKLDLNQKLVSNIANIIEKRTKERTAKKEKEEVNLLLDFDESSIREIFAVSDFLKSSFINQFDSIINEEKRIRTDLNNYNRKIRQAESKKGNALIAKLQEDKKELEQRKKQLAINLEELLSEQGALTLKLASNRKVLSEQEKIFTLIELDNKKYEVTNKLLLKIEELIERVKIEKKHSLEKAILSGLNKLLHKQNFINRVKVNIQNDIMDIDLIDHQGMVIDKESLSKGEQQLYATSLLKALVDESKINFPVFIDSPLQKFDKQHSKNVIQQFYPTISKQVVLLPLLEKELSFEEFEQISPNLNGTFLIENRNGSSRFVQYDPKDLFNEFNKQGDAIAH